MNNNVSDEIQKIKDDLENSGFPLEIDATSTLAEDGWRVRNQVYYVDKDEEKPRTVDIIAHKAFFEKLRDHDRLNISLVIECKKSSKPWVFFSTPKGEGFSVTLFALIKHLASPKLKYSIFFPQWMRDSHYASANFKEKAIIAYEPFKNGRGQEIFKAINQVTKALDFELENFKKFLSQVPMKPVFILFPVIVFDGHLFECKSLNGGMDVMPTDYLQYSVDQEELFLIDVVRKEFLPEYLKIIDKEIEALRLLLKK